MKKNFFCTKTELLSFKITQPLAKLDMVSWMIASNGLIFLDGILVGVHLATFLLLFDISELTIAEKNKKFW